MNKAQEAVTEMAGQADDVRVALLRNNDRGVLDITVADLKHWAHLERTMPALERELHTIHDAAEAYIRNHGHKITCANMLSQQGPCNCGYAELRLALDGGGDAPEAKGAAK